jgi:hypothetical protein
MEITSFRLETGLYVIKNKYFGYKTAMKLIIGSPEDDENPTRLDHTDIEPNSESFFCQLWWIERTRDEEYYTITNAQTGTVVQHADEHQGNEQFYRVNASPPNKSMAQRWYIRRDEDKNAF